MQLHTTILNLPVKHILSRPFPAATLILALNLPLIPQPSPVNAGENDIDDYSAWRTASNRTLSTIQSTASFTVESSNAAQPYRLRARAGVWFAAPSGDFRLGYNSTDISLEHQLNLNDPNPSFTGDITIDFPGQDDRWMLWFDIFNTSQKATGTMTAAAQANGTTIPAGTTVESSFASTSFAAHLGYDLFENLLADNQNDNANSTTQLRIHAIAGLRALHLDQSFRALTTGVNANYDNWHAIAEAGARLSIFLVPKHKSNGTIDISLNMTGGYGLTEGNLKTFDLFTAITWMPTDNLGFTAGYRLFHINLDNVTQSNGQPFTYQGNQAGFFLGGQLQF